MRSLDVTSALLRNDIVTIGFSMRNSIQNTKPLLVAGMKMRGIRIN